MRPVEIIFKVAEAPEGGYDAKALGHSIFTQTEVAGRVRRSVRDQSPERCAWLRSARLMSV